MTIIKIDRATIKRNPNAGATSFTVKMGDDIRSFEFFMMCPQKEYENRRNEIEKFFHLEITMKISHSEKMVSMDLRGTVKHEYRDWSDKHIMAACHINPKMTTIITKVQNYVFHSISPAPKYLYSYENPMVTCNSCTGTFSAGELQADSMDDGDGESYSNEICPLCGHWDCCDIEYEDIGKISENEIEEAIKKNTGGES